MIRQEDYNIDAILLCDPIGSLDGVAIYMEIGDLEDNLELYFVKAGRVLGHLNVQAECTQNFGFLSNYNFNLLEEV